MINATETDAGVVSELQLKLQMSQMESEQANQIK